MSCPKVLASASRGQCHCCEKHWTLRIGPTATTTGPISEASCFLALSMQTIDAQGSHARSKLFKDRDGSRNRDFGDNSPGISPIYRWVRVVGIFMFWAKHRSRHTKAIEHTITVTAWSNQPSSKLIVDKRCVIIPGRWIRGTHTDTIVGTSTTAPVITTSHRNGMGSATPGLLNSDAPCLFTHLEQQNYLTEERTHVKAQP
ncbi:hypothetical protein QBC41DRAFT_148289 [Cercophora samala]|uniref:Uncharacterized protein n=1 Tax=Cercophora samala TaxID=330535 RepID=A0AA39Z9C4_9PEZI|nr:hypothetical protein QBC41DRAFT_148289 [Cercophora samala]